MTYDSGQGLDLLKKIQDSTDYLKIEDLKHGYTYKIFARRAYVGVWLEKKKAFMISRIKGILSPYLYYEFHWDTNDEVNFPYGTAKPLGLIEKFPFELKEDKEDYADNEAKEIINYLDKLEDEPSNQWISVLS